MYLYDLQMRILFSVSVSDFFLKFIHISLFQVILLWVILSEFSEKLQHRCSCEVEIIQYSQYDFSD